MGCTRANILVGAICGTAQGAESPEIRHPSLSNGPNARISADDVEWSQQTGRDLVIGSVRTACIYQWTDTKTRCNRDLYSENMRNM